MSVLFILGACNIVPNNVTSSPSFEQAEGTVTIGEQTFPMILDQYVWKENNIEVSTVSEEDIFLLAEEFPTVEVGKEEKIYIEVTQAPSSLKVIQWNEDGTSEEVSLTDDEMLVPEDEGYYIFEVQATWSQGEYVYVFDIERM